MQAQIRCGDTLDFTTTLTDYPASAGWVLTYRLIPRTSGAAIAIAGIAVGDDHRTVAAAASTAAWAAGNYSWVAYVELASERYTVDSGVVTLLPDLETAAAYDGRSQAEIALDAVNAVIANRATVDQKAYTIAGRSLERMDVSELLKLRSALMVDVMIERASKNAAKGLADPRRIYLRAGRA